MLRKNTWEAADQRAGVDLPLGAAAGRVPAPSSSPPAVRVLFVAGAGRSGSTVISSILGQLPGCVCTGELRFLWTRGVALDQVCGCGRPFSACALWQAVVRGLGPDGVPDAEATGERLRNRLRAVRVPLLLIRRAVGMRPVSPHPDDSRIVRLYRSVQEVTGASVIVDASKLPPYGMLLQHLPGIEVTVLHVIRDPRAAAFSWSRHKSRRLLGDDSAMTRLPPAKSSVLWLLWNLLAVLVWRGGSTARPGRPRVLRVRYEEFVAAPREVLSRVARVLGEDETRLPFVDEHSVRLQPTHAVAGNPVRRDSGLVQLCEDREWVTAMSRRDRQLVTLVTLPALVGLGYPVRPGGRLTRRASTR